MLGAGTVQAANVSAHFKHILFLALIRPDKIFPIKQDGANNDSEDSEIEEDDDHNPLKECDDEGKAEEEEDEEEEE